MGQLAIRLDRHETAIKSLVIPQAGEGWGEGRQQLNWFCYLLRCADDTLYCGITNDLEKRLAAHNAGTASKYTRVRLPVELVYAGSCSDRSAASKREMEIKGLKRADKLALIKAATQKNKKNL